MKPATRTAGRPDGVQGTRRGIGQGADHDAGQGARQGIGPGAGSRAPAERHGTDAHTEGAL